MNDADLGLRENGVAGPAIAGNPQCSLCDAPADGRLEVTGACILRLCTTCAKDTHRVASGKNYTTKWQRIDGNAVALVVVLLAFFLMPGCKAGLPVEPPSYTGFVIVTVFLIVFALIAIAPRSWFVSDCGGCGKCDDCDKGVKP